MLPTMSHLFSGIQCGKVACKGKPNCLMYHSGDPLPKRPQPPLIVSPFKKMSNRPIFATPKRTAETKEIHVDAEKCTFPVISGLENPTNYCFLNSAMQVLANLPGVTNDVMKSFLCNQHESNKNIYTTTVGRVLQDMTSGK